MAPLPHRCFAAGSRQAPDPHDQYLEKEHYYRKHTARDNSSLFRCISEQLFDTQRYHKRLRETCVAYMLRNRDFFECHVDGDFDEYMLTMSKMRTRGTLLELRALAYCYGRNVTLFEPYTLGRTFVHLIDTKGDQFLVFVTSDYHFDSVYAIDYIADAAFCQSLVYEVLYRNVFKLPDVEYAVERMLHDPLGDNIRIVTETIYPPTTTSQTGGQAGSAGTTTAKGKKSRARNNNNTSATSIRTKNGPTVAAEETTGMNVPGTGKMIKKAITGDNREFVFESSDSTSCILEDYRLCHFHNSGDFDKVVAAIQDTGRPDNCTSNNNTLNRSSLSTTTTTSSVNTPLTNQRNQSNPPSATTNSTYRIRYEDALLRDKNVSCVLQLLHEGITPFPYKVAKALDPYIYRNIEFDVWNELRKENRLRFNMKRLLLVGDKCFIKAAIKRVDMQAGDGPLNDGIVTESMYVGHIQHIEKFSGLYHVYVEELGKQLVVTADVLRSYEESHHHHHHRHYMYATAARYHHNQHSQQQQPQSQYSHHRVATRSYIYNRAQHNSTPYRRMTTTRRYFESGDCKKKGISMEKVLSDDVYLKSIFEPTKLFNAYCLDQYSKLLQPTFDGNFPNEIVAMPAFVKQSPMKEQGQVGGGGGTNGNGVGVVEKKMSENGNGNAIVGECGDQMKEPEGSTVDEDPLSKMAGEEYIFGHYTNADAIYSNSTIAVAAAGPQQQMHQHQHQQQYYANPIYVATTPDLANQQYYPYYRNGTYYYNYYPTYVVPAAAAAANHPVAGANMLQQQQQHAAAACYGPQVFQFQNVMVKRRELLQTDGPVNSNVSPSFMAHGQDLPMNDMNSLRFFYNLGHECFAYLASLNGGAQNALAILQQPVATLINQQQQPQQHNLLHHQQHPMLAPITPISTGTLSDTTTVAVNSPTIDPSVEQQLKGSFKALSLDGGSNGDSNDRSNSVTRNSTPSSNLSSNVMTSAEIVGNVKNYHGQATSTTSYVANRKPGNYSRTYTRNSNSGGTANGGNNYRGGKHGHNPGGMDRRGDGSNGGGGIRNGSGHQSNYYNSNQQQQHQGGGGGGHQYKRYGGNRYNNHNYNNHHNNNNNNSSSNVGGKRETKNQSPDNLSSSPYMNPSSTPTNGNVHQQMSTMGSGGGGGVNVNGGLKMPNTAGPDGNREDVFFYATNAIGGGGLSQDMMAMGGIQQLQQMQQPQHQQQQIMPHVQAGAAQSMNQILTPIPASAAYQQQQQQHSNNNNNSNNTFCQQQQQPAAMIGSNGGQNHQPMPVYNPAYYYATYFPVEVTPGADGGGGVGQMQYVASPNPALAPPNGVFSPAGTAPHLRQVPPVTNAVAAGFYQTAPPPPVPQQPPQQHDGWFIEGGDQQQQQQQQMLNH